MGAWRTPVDVICEHAGAYDDLCRQNWVVEAAEKDSTLSLEELLPACGSDQDCLFEVLDTRIPLDPLAAAARCTPTVPRHEQDCLGHSLAWWAATTWDPESIQKILPFGERFPDTVGFHVGTLVGCRGVGSCPPEGELNVWCERRVYQVKRDQQTCQQRGGPKLALQRPGDPSPP